MSRKALIIAGDTDGNLGDLAIVTATIEMMLSLDPDIQIAMLTGKHERDVERLGIFPLARGVRGLAALVRWARDADLIICGGGGLFQDDDSLLKMPYWALRLFLIRFLSGPIAGLSIGAGPLDYRISRFFARFALRQLDPVSVRDTLAQSALAPLTQKTVDVVPDPAFLLTASTENRARENLQKSGVPIDGGPVIGVAVRRWFHKKSSLIPYKYASKLGLQQNRGAQEMSTFINLAAAVLDEVVEETNAHVVFMPTYNVEHEADNEVCAAIAERMQTGNYSTLLLDDPNLYKAVTGLLAVMLCGRMHPAILAAGQGTPVVGLAYNPKFFGMFSMLEQESQCMSINDFVQNESSGELAEMLVAAIREPSRYRPDTAEIESKTRNFIEKIVATTTTAR